MNSYRDLTILKTTITANAQTLCIQAIASTVLTISQNQNTYYIQMEPKPAYKNTSNSVSHEVFDDHLEKIVQEFTKFQGRMSEKGCNRDMKLEDLIDMYINCGGVNENSPVYLNETESVLLPHQVQYAQVQNPHGSNINREIQESDIMIDVMSQSEDTSQNDTGNFPDSSPTVNTNCQLGPGDSNSRVTHITYGDLNCPGVADHIIGSAFGCSAETVFCSVMKSFKNPGADGMNLWHHLGVKENGDGATSGTSIKRKYKQITETEEETARQMEITTIMNGGASAKACAKNQFLEGRKRISLSPAPLRSEKDHIRSSTNLVHGRGSAIVCCDLRMYKYVASGCCTPLHN